MYEKRLLIVSGAFLAFLSFALLTIGGCRTRNENVISSSGLDRRPESACPPPDRPQGVISIKLEQRFSRLSFQFPVALLQDPSRDDTWFLLEQTGRVLAFIADDNTDTYRVVLDIRDRVISGGERGLLGMAFHPLFEQNGRVYLSYTGRNTQDQLVSIISVFNAEGTPLSFNPGSERILISQLQPYANHNGGHIEFGADGYLYIGFGDGGSGGDPFGFGQRLDTLLGKMLRIDVDGAPPYAIPPDNPFSSGGGLPEIYAWGFRNPWRWSFDPESRILWMGDVGQSQWEEINQVKAGGNYGWSVREGAHCYPWDPCDPKGLTDPVAEYPHSEGCSVTGGYVYHGNAVPRLNGVYLFGDYCNGNLWGIFYDNNGNPYHELLLSSGLNISSFARDRNGEVYILDLYTGRIFQIQADQSQPSPFPILLSQTPFVDPGDPHKAAPCMIPYDVLVPFWSDGAVKERWFSIPPDQTIDIDEEGHFIFPKGSVLMKNFTLKGKQIETRFLIRHEDGEWAGYSYEWNDAETDASLLQGEKIKDINGQDWIYPSRAQCLQCHTKAAGRALGLEMIQLNRLYTYQSTERTANQLSTYEAINLFSQPLPASPNQLSSLPASAELINDPEQLVFAYFHSNCSNCHRPGGVGRGLMDFRFTTPLTQKNIYNITPLISDLGITDARLVAPGSPERSILLQRMKRFNIFRMPPIGSRVEDNQGTTMIELWIRELQ